MSKERKSTLREIMLQAWSFVKRNGYTMAEAMKVAWLNFKLKAAMKMRIVQFFFVKVDGTTRQAFGTLQASMMGETKGSGRKPNDNLQVYWDCEKGEYRSFKKCNLIKMI